MYPLTRTHVSVHMYAVFLSSHVIADDEYWPWPVKEVEVFPFLRSLCVQTFGLKHFLKNQILHYFCLDFQKFKQNFYKGD